MSDLIAIAYPDEAAARRACTNLAAGVERTLLDVEDVLVITHDDVPATLDGSRIEIMERS